MANYTSAGLRNDIGDVNAELAARGYLGRFYLDGNFRIDLYRAGMYARGGYYSTAREARMGLFEMAFVEALNGPRVTIEELE